MKTNSGNPTAAHFAIYNEDIKLNNGVKVTSIKEHAVYS